VVEVVEQAVELVVEVELVDIENLVIYLYQVDQL
tara:strand:+ start:53 stop:154 length:102 start_codon:yes stop_codon:yes gene_type:complete